jgi:hypothetical protein
MGDLEGALGTPVVVNFSTSIEINLSVGNKTSTEVDAFPKNSRKGKKG